MWTDWINWERIKRYVPDVLLTTLQTSLTLILIYREYKSIRIALDYHTAQSEHTHPCISLNIPYIENCLKWKLRLLMGVHFTCMGLFLTNAIKFKFGFIQYKCCNRLEEKKNRTPFPGKDSLQTPIKNTIEICTTLSDLNTRSDGQTDLIIHSFYLHCAKRPWNVSAFQVINVYDLF